MKRWSQVEHDEVERPAVDAFLAEVIEVARRHKLSISHEDGHGSFVIEELSEDNLNWLANASVAV